MTAEEEEKKKKNFEVEANFEYTAKFSTSYQIEAETEEEAEEIAERCMVLELDHHLWSLNQSISDSLEAALANPTYENQHTCAEIECEGGKFSIEEI